MKFIAPQFSLIRQEKIPLVVFLDYESINIIGYKTKTNTIK